jgi:hypothetical protein
MWNTARAARPDDRPDLGLALHRAGRSRSTRGFMPCQPPRRPRRQAQRRARRHHRERGHVAVARPAAARVLRPRRRHAAGDPRPRRVRRQRASGAPKRPTPWSAGAAAPWPSTASSLPSHLGVMASCCYQSAARPSLHPRRHFAPRVTTITAEMTSKVVTPGARSTPGAGVTGWNQGKPAGVAGATAGELGRAVERASGRPRAFPGKAPHDFLLLSDWPGLPS